MFIIECHICNRTHLGTNHAVRSMRKTEDGMLATVECPAGHMTTHLFAKFALATRQNTSPASPEATTSPIAVPLSAGRERVASGSRP